MGSSYVEYRGRGFWSWDGYLEHFLSALSALSKEQHVAWLFEAQEHWNLQSQGAFGGWIQPKFDEFLATDERRDAVLSMVQMIVHRPDITSELARTCDLVVRLLREELSTDASSPLDYMVSGKRPYCWRR